MILKSLPDLKRVLASPLKLIIVAAEDDYRRSQCQDTIHRHLKKQHGEIDNNKHFVNSTFKWDALLKNNSQISLFASFNLVECHNIDNKFPRPAGKTLSAWIETASDNELLVLYCSKLTNAQMNTAWGKLCASSGAIMRLWPINPEQMPQQISEMAAALNLRLNRDATLILASATEGNLLATEQCLQKLAISSSTETITENQIRPLLSSSTSFGTFDWIDAALSGKAMRAHKIFMQLKAAKQEPLMMLGAMLKTIREATAIAEIKNYTEKENALKKFWPSRRQLIQNALSRRSIAQWHDLFSKSLQVDQACKGRSDINIDAAWLLLGDLALSIAGTKTVGTHNEQ
jgi:DNA polymerase III subunit delta